MYQNYQILELSNYGYNKRGKVLLQKFWTWNGKCSLLNKQILMGPVAEWLRYVHLNPETVCLKPTSQVRAYDYLEQVATIKRTQE